MDVLPQHELVIFDCDGVIVDSERLSALIDERVLNTLGWNITAPQIASLYLGRTQDEFYRDVSERLNIPVTWYLEFEGWYEEAFRTKLRAVPGARELIEKLRVPYCIASNSSIESISRKLEFCGLLHLFSGRIFSAEMVERPKPAPDIHLAIMDSYSVSPSDCLIVEDSPRGIEAAVRAGARVVALRSDLVDPRALAAADLIVDSLDKLKTLLVEGHS
ncbi:HAD family hydrolase [Nocardiopsis dassonvillei]|uniref:HAD family hydrolase n=1 Tax=Nocardiopsis dassonvillei TaxID=2014 RepID=UPI00366B67CD